MKAQVPLSFSYAKGLILAHGHIGKHILLYENDVFISKDGGYTWIKILSGPHVYSILDYGSLLVAFEVGAHFFKYSFDYGSCWHEYSVSNNYKFFMKHEKKKSLVLFLVGLSFNNEELRLVSIDFKTVLKSKCKNSNYEIMRLDSSMYCYNGIKPIFKRKRKNSLCYFGNDYTKGLHEETCKCEKRDYTCDNGFIKQDTDCVFNETNYSVCGRKNRQHGYIKKEHSKCQGGYVPENDQKFEKHCELARKKYLNKIKEKSEKLNGKNIMSESKIADSNESLAHESSINNQKIIVLLLVFGAIFITLIFTLAIIWCIKKRKGQFNYVKLDNSKKVENTDNEDSESDEKAKMLKRNKAKIKISNGSIFKK